MCYIVTKYWTEKKTDPPSVNQAIEQEMELTIVKSKEEFKLLRKMYSQKHNGAYVYFMYTKIN